MAEQAGRHNEWLNLTGTLAITMIRGGRSGPALKNAPYFAARSYDLCSNRAQAEARAIVAAWHSASLGIRSRAAKGNHCLLSTPTVPAEYT